MNPQLNHSIAGERIRELGEQAARARAARRVDHEGVPVTTTIDTQSRTRSRLVAFAVATAAATAALLSSSASASAVGQIAYDGCLANDASQGCFDLPFEPLTGPAGVAVSPGTDRQGFIDDEMSSPAKPVRIRT